MRDTKGRFVKGNKLGFQVGHPNYLTEESILKIKSKMKSRKITWGDKISKAKKGIKKDPEQMKRLRLLNKGRTPWNKGLKGYLSGDKNPAWKHGLGNKNKTARQIEMHSIEYRDWRKKVFERDNYTCVLCGAKGNVLNADHIKSWKDYTDLRYSIDNGRTLCKECHIKTPNYGAKK